MNFNKAFILGNLTRDPELRQTPTGQSVAAFGVATNRFFTDKTGTKQQQAEFHNIVAWGKLGEICGQYLQKGSLIFIEGRIQTRSWQDQTGQKRYKTEIIAESMQMGPRHEKTNDPGGKAPEETHQDNSSIPVINYPDDEIQIKDIPF